MGDKKRKILSLIISGHGDTEEVCWKNFDTELEKTILLTKGYRYWRVLPEYLNHKDFENNIELKEVRARVIISDMEPIGDFEIIRGIPALKKNGAFESYNG